MSCLGCQNRCPACWDTCEEYKAYKALRQAQKRYLQQFACLSIETRREIIRIHERRERKKRR